MTKPAHAHSTSRDTAIGRVRVEDGSTAFSQGVGMRVSEPVALTAVSDPTIQFEFDSPIDFMLLNQSVSCDLGGFTYQVFREAQGSVTAPFTGTVGPIKRNLRSDAPAYTPQIAIRKGGVFTPTALEVPVDTINVLAGGQVKKISNVSADESSVRGLPAGKYYILITAIAGITGAISGVLELLYDEA